MTGFQTSTTSSAIKQQHRQFHPSLASSFSPNHSLNHTHFVGSNLKKVITQNSNNIQSVTQSYFNIFVILVTYNIYSYTLIYFRFGCFMNFLLFFFLYNHHIITIYKHTSCQSNPSQHPDIHSNKIIILCLAAYMTYWHLAVYKMF